MKSHLVEMPLQIRYYYYYYYYYYFTENRGNKAKEVILTKYQYLYDLIAFFLEAYPWYGVNYSQIASQKLIWYMYCKKPPLPLH